MFTLKYSGGVAPLNNSFIFFLTVGHNLLALIYFSQAWSMAVLKNCAISMGAGPLIVILTEVLGLFKSMPLYNFLASSIFATFTPALPILPYTSNLFSGSCPYKVTLSNAVERRIEFCPLLKK